MGAESSELRGQPYAEGRHFRVDSLTGCWNWTGAQLRGYAHASGTRPHRRAYLATVGPIPDGYDLHHLCRNPLCVNPAHMEPVERRAHRAAHRREDSPLTAADVVKIRELAWNGTPLARLASAFDVHPTTVQDIVSGNHWSEVGGPIGRPKTVCGVCGRPLTGRRHKRYCDPKCRKRAENAARKARRLADVGA